MTASVFLGSDGKGGLERTGGDREVISRRCDGLQRGAGGFREVMEDL